MGALLNQEMSMEGLFGKHIQGSLKNGSQKMEANISEWINISVGDSVETDCVHWYESSTYEILKLTVTTHDENGEAIEDSE